MEYIRNARIPKGCGSLNFLEASNLEERLHLMQSLSQRFDKRAAEIDEKGLFPFENIKELTTSGYTSLTIPKQYGGKAISLYELVRLQEELAKGDGSTALSIGWHMSVMQNLAEKAAWEEDTFTRVVNAVKQGALINSAASERETGSPTRGGKPVTTAITTKNGWVINGRKAFTTLSPMLDYFLISATVVETGEIGNFLVHRSLPGVRIEETWDSIAMRGTGSHDLVLENVVLGEKDFVEKLQQGKKGANGGLLHVPSCYLGIAGAAKRYAVDFAKQYSPNSIEGPIIQLANVQEKIGKMELLIMQSQHFLYSVAKLWDSSSKNERGRLGPELAAVKHSVTNSALKVVDLAMRVVGAGSLSVKNPLQRYYRDVRAGLHNPPMDDMTIKLLAKNAIEANS